MLKKTLMISCVGILLASQNVQAGEIAQNGAWGGAAGGAILGQAIGRNTKGTLLGTAIGGVLGYMVGNEMEKGPGQTVRVYSPPTRVVHQYEDDDDYEYRVVHYRPVVYCPTERVVRETVIIDRDEPPRWGHRWGHRRGYERDHWRSGRFDRDRED